MSILCRGPHQLEPHQLGCPCAQPQLGAIERSRAALFTTLYPLFNAKTKAHFPPELVSLILSFAAEFCQNCSRFHLSLCDSSAPCLNLLPIKLDSSVSLNGLIPYTPTLLPDEEVARCFSDKCSRSFCDYCMEDELTVCDECGKYYCVDLVRDCGKFKDCVCECKNVCKTCATNRLYHCHKTDCKNIFCSCANCFQRLTVTCQSCGIFTCRYEVCSAFMNECDGCLLCFCDDCVDPHLNICIGTFHHKPLDTMVLVEDFDDDQEVMDDDLGMDAYEAEGIVGGSVIEMGEAMLEEETD